MYICDDCGNVFENYIEDVTDYGQTIIVSPCCLETFEEAEACERCEKYIPKENINSKLCSACEEELSHAYIYETMHITKEV